MLLRRLREKISRLRQFGVQYESRKSLLSPAEISFYRVMSLVLPNSVTIFAKVRLADIVNVAVAGRGKRARALLAGIARCHVDFLICETDTSRIILAIELDDSSHNNRQGHDWFITDTFRKAGIPLERFPVQRGYIVKEVENRLSPYLTELSDTHP